MRYMEVAHHLNSIERHHSSFRKHSDQLLNSTIAHAALSSLTFFNQVLPDKWLTWSFRKDLKSHQCNCSVSINQQQKNSLKCIRASFQNLAEWLSIWHLVLALLWRLDKKMLLKASESYVAPWILRLQRTSDKIL